MRKTNTKMRRLFGDELRKTLYVHVIQRPSSMTIPSILNPNHVNFSSLKYEIDACRTREVIC